MGGRRFKVPGPTGTRLNLGGPTLRRPAILDNPALLPLKDDALKAWNQVVQWIDPARLSALLNEIYGSERWSDPDQTDTEGNTTDPKNARLPSRSRERDARRPTDTPTLRLKDPKVAFENGSLNGTASFVLEIPTAYPQTFDSPTLIRVQLRSPRLDHRHISIGGRATAFGKLVRARFNVQLHYDPRDVVKAAVAIARNRGITKETLETLLADIRFDVSAFGWVFVLPTWLRLSASALLPLDRPLLGTADRLLPAQLGALPGSSLLNYGTIMIPSGVFFDTSAPAAGAHWSRFDRTSGYSLTGGLVAVPNLDQLGKDMAKALSVYGYVDLYYVKRVTQTVDLGFGLTYAIDVFGKRKVPGPAHLHFLEAKHQPWLPTSRENVPPSEDRSGQRLMFMLKGSHDLLGGH